MFAAAMDLRVAADDAQFLPALMQYLLSALGYPDAQGDGGNVPQPRYFG